MSQDLTRPPSPILIVPYVWIGDFVRCHSVVKLLRAQGAGAAGRYRLEFAMRAARRLHAGRAPGDRHRSAAAAAGHGAAAAARRQAARERLCASVGNVAQMESGAGAVDGRHSVAHRFCRRSSLRPHQRHALGERRLPRMIDHMGALALPKGAPLPSEWPLPELKVPQDEVTNWRAQRGLGKRWPPDRHAVARRGGRRQGLATGPLRRTGAFAHR